MTTASLATVGTISHAVIEVADLSASIDFYERVFGMSVLMDNRANTPSYVTGVLGDLAVEIVQLPDTPDLASFAARRREMPSVWISLTVKDAEAAYESIKPTGFVAKDLVCKPSGSKFFSVRDPDGYLIELIELAEKMQSLHYLVLARKCREGAAS
jgi:catechol 2,3-dioxygenase-like lactoylglutathione lyase family enzyme